MKSVICAVCLTIVSSIAAHAGVTYVELATQMAAAGDGFALKGSAPGWLFLRDDVAHLGKGEFWKAAPSPAIPIITKFRESLSAAGIALILAPVPSKAAVYPDKLLGGATPGAMASSAPFLKELETTGAVVIDLETLFRQEREKAPVFCASDSHWSPAGAVLAAKAIAGTPVLAALAKPGQYVVSGAVDMTITGDLAASPGLEATPKEQLALTKAGTGSPAAPEPVPAAAGSPVILMGDSHTMVFSDGASLGMHCQGAGLRDHLQARLGFPLIQLSSQNSGGTGARRLFNQRLQGNPAYLKDVKAVIWVFSIREFTMGKWR